MEKKDNVRLLACHFKRNVEMSVRMVMFYLSLLVIGDKDP
jgi:hypothetical protein